MMNKEQMIEMINRGFSDLNILVIGDIMVDEYITGRVSRISPEAPIPILNFSEKRMEAGGASNVAHNLKSLGAKVKVIGVLGNDSEGKWLQDHFKKIGIDISDVLILADRCTTTKTRYATKGQQLLRVDNENTQSISNDRKIDIINRLNCNISTLNAVVLSDYQKGMLVDDDLVRDIIKLCNENNVVILIDSKSEKIEAFENADFVKPNNVELENAVGIKIVDDSTLDEAGEIYLNRSKANNLIVTRGSKGISLFCKGQNRKDFPAKDVQVYDVCGAGDTVISTIALSVSSGINISDAIALANYAAGVVINKVGTVAITREELVGALSD